MTDGTTAILDALHHQASGYLTLAELQQRAGLSASRVADGLAELQQRGYQIEVNPHFGCRLVETPDQLTADGIRALLAARVIGREIQVFAETTSTNDVVARLARTATPEGITVFAEAQTAGRGRRGRVWHSPRGTGLWFSVLLRPPWPLEAHTRLTIAAGSAVARTIRQCTQLDARVKWPNDVTVQGRKVAGVLTEAGPGYAILGIGVNVNTTAAAFPAELREQATSLRLASGRGQDRVELAARLLAALDAEYARAQADFDAVAAAWAERCDTLGQQLVVTMGTRRVEGLAHALDGDGALLLRKDNGQIERICGGDIVVERT